MKNKSYFSLKEKKIITELNSLAKKISYHNKLYHDLNKPIINDGEFDKLIKRNDFLENKFPHLKIKDGPNKNVGSKVSNKFNKISHSVPMLSLANAFNYNELIEFEKRIRKYINDKSAILEFICEPKIDGISINLTYKNGNLITAATRGDGIIGEDVTENVKTIKDIPKIFKKNNLSEVIEIRGEIFLEKYDFLKLNETFHEKNKFSNPRNAAAGSIRQIDKNVTKSRPLKFIAHGFGIIPKKYNTLGVDQRTQ